MGIQATGGGRASPRIVNLMVAAFLMALALAGCGAGGSTSSSGSGDWFYHWNCNGDPECLATNPTGAASGTSDEGPAEAACTPLLQFAQQFWGTAATDSCDQNANGSSGGNGGGGGNAPTISSFSPAASAPCTQVTLTGTNFPTSVTGVTVTFDGMTGTVNSSTSTSITFTLPCPMPNFTGTITVKTSGGSVTSGSSFTAVNHLYGVGASSTQFVAVGGGGTLLTSPDCSTWTAQASHTTVNLYAVASSGSVFVVTGQNGTVLRSTDGISWTQENVSGNLTNLYGVNWSGTQFVAIGDSLTVFTSPDGANWTLHGTLPTSAVYGGLAWSGVEYVAVGGITGGSPAILKSTDGITWTPVSATAASGLQLLGAAFGNGEFVAVGDGDTVVTSTDATTWTRQTESFTADLAGIAWSGSLFVAVGNNSTSGSVIVTSPDGVNWTGRGVSANNRSLNAVTWSSAKGEFVAVGGYGTIVTSLDGATWTLRAGD